ncbi:MAG: hypothetical protein J0M04_10815 [Verrucomicrobia bacterium]|nr:hypothetical protein [Verrucomicrobiota bacterium]
MNKESSLTWGSQQAFAVRVMMVVLLGSGIGGADEQQHATQTTPAKVEVRALEIRPSHESEDYEGRFLFIHHGKQPLKIDCFERPMGQRYHPNSIQFQILKNGVWERVETSGHGWCWDYDIPPGVPCELDVDLGAFNEQNTPQTCRVIFNWDKYPSEPFVLDWKADRKAGKFLAAKKAFVDRLRARFLKSGFRPELLKGDEFPRQIGKEMIARVTKTGQVGAWFGLQGGDLEVETRLFWNGDVFLEFSCLNDDREGYSGTLQWNPESMNRALLQKLRKTDGEAFPEHSDEHDRVNGLIMRINPEYPIIPGTVEYEVQPFIMFLGLTLPKDRVFAEPLKDECAKVFDAAMDYLEGCLAK